MVRPRKPTPQAKPLQIDFDFILEGNVRRDPMGVRVTTWLSDTRKCIQIWSMLAAQYADNCGMESVGQLTPLEKAAEFARKGFCDGNQS